MGNVVDFSSYRNIDAVNFSSLKHMAKSPLHFDWARKNPSEDTPGRLKGRGTHTAVLEMDRFLLDFALFKGKTRRGKEWDAFVAVHPEENILKVNEYEHCLRVARAIRANPEAGALLNGAETEKTIEWVDRETGLKCKARIDIWNDGTLADVKGVKSVDGHALASEIARQDYFCQLAFYSTGMESVLGISGVRTALICAEHAAPHDVAVVEPDDGSMEAAHAKVRGWLNRVAECTKTGKWPGRYDKRQLIALPPWAFDDYDDDDDFSFEVLSEEG